MIEKSLCQYHFLPRKKFLDAFPQIVFKQHKMPNDMSSNHYLNLKKKIQVEIFLLKHLDQNR